ncbi:hypothetical protein PM082_009976 [Marasmius tenuissimus]|nr:hypothetical protein PM082_015260 [Marasmius tenuissimus]KAJ8094765.1 hypothetical protein PM082_009976 [Marasmius tenuissimus]
MTLLSFFYLHADHVQTTSHFGRLHLTELITFSPPTTPTAAIPLDALPRSFSGPDADSSVLAVDDYPLSFVLIGSNGWVLLVNANRTPSSSYFQVEPTYTLATSPVTPKQEDWMLTTVNAIRNPSFLIKHANPGAPIKPLDGRVGNVWPNDVLVTSPNMDLLYKPPTGLCRVRLRRDNHFGPDDPLYHPQPFDRQHAHLAVLRVKGSVLDDPLLETAWLIPKASNFVECPACGGLGRLDLRIRNQFTSLCLNVIAKFPSDAHTTDRLVGEGTIHLQRLLDQLDAPASQKDTFLRFSCAQRQVLELLARFEWVTVYRSKYMGKDRGCPLSVNMNVMGAFTEDYDVLDSLYHAGIPVWYIRPISASPEVRIDAVVDFIHDTNSFSLALRFGDVLDTSDATPPYRIVYSHLAGKPERYLAMGNFIRSLFHYPRLLGSAAPRSSTSIIRSNRPTRTLRPFSAFSDENPPRTSSSKPYPSKAPTNKGGAINPFLVTSPLLPPSVSAWSDALRTLSHHDLTIPPPPGHDRGYWVPPARLFVTPDRDESKLTLLRNWLRLREVIIFRATTGASRLSVKDWRSLLTISGGDSKKVSDTRSGKRHDSMRTLLKDFLTENSLSLKYDELPGIAAKWRGVEISDEKLPGTTVVQEILWELTELSFRQELVALDGELDTSDVGKWERQNLLDGCWKGGRADWVNGSEGLGSRTLEARIPYLTRLHRVMSTWRGDRPLELLDSFPSRDAHNFLVTANRVERALASFYTSSFLSVFGREASVPHTLS